MKNPIVIISLIIAQSTVNILAYASDAEDPLEEFLKNPPKVEIPDPKPEPPGSIRAKISEDDALKLARQIVIEAYGDRYVITEINDDSGKFLLIQDAPSISTADSANLFPKVPVHEPSISDKIKTPPPPKAESSWSRTTRKIESKVKDIPVSVGTHQDASGNTIGYEIRYKGRF